MSQVPRIREWASLVKFSHTIFALPFALTMLLVLARTYGVTWVQLLLVICAVASARTAAMAFNRLVDAAIDSRNPRTQEREIPAGRVSRWEAGALTVASAAVFMLSAGLLGAHCVVLAPPVLLVLLGYSYFKRFSALSHFVLGLALALAPGGVWYALTATWSWQPVPLMGAVLLWVAGFDILYSCQDMDFDLAHRLHSVPRYIGHRRATVLAALLHAASVPLLILFGAWFDLGLAYMTGVAVFTAIIASQHVTVQKRGIACIDHVFFTRNGLASVLFLLFVALDVL